MRVPPIVGYTSGQGSNIFHAVINSTIGRVTLCGRVPMGTLMSSVREAILILGGSYWCKRCRKRLVSTATAESMVLPIVGEDGC